MLLYFKLSCYLIMFSQTSGLVTSIIFAFFLASIISLGMSLFGHYSLQGVYNTKSGKKL
ncbi:DUF6814 family protein [Emticicia sp. C21]|uniref:DUF6814 family protein n=1 Tax=Emticicia sp. C21 TaxID=2302915 RepID=UPI0038D4E018